MIINKRILLSLVALLTIIMTACKPDENESIAGNGVDVSSVNVNITTYDIEANRVDGIPDIVCSTKQSVFFWCATGDELYRGGSTISLYEMDLVTKVISQIQLPYGEGWKLDAMHRDSTDGFWMVFSKVLSSSGVHTGDSYGDSILIRTDSNFEELFCVELSEYASECVIILGNVYNTESEYVQDLMEEMGYKPVANKSFAGAKLACDDQGNVYVTSALERVVVFDEAGTFLGSFSIYDYEYADQVYLIEDKSGSVFAACYSELKHYYVKLNMNDWSVGDRLLPSSDDKWYYATPAVTLLPQYDLFEVSTGVLYGVTLGDSEYSIEKIVDIDENILPGIYGTTLQSLTMASNDDSANSIIYVFSPGKQS